MALLMQATQLTLENQQLKQQLAATKEQHAAPATFNEVQTSHRHPDPRPSR